MFKIIFLSLSGLIALRFLLQILYWRMTKGKNYAFYCFRRGPFWKQIFSLCALDFIVLLMAIVSKEIHWIFIIPFIVLYVGLFIFYLDEIQETDKKMSATIPFRSHLPRYSLIPFWFVKLFLRG